jgi:hypothetical protein
MMQLSTQFLILAGFLGQFSQNLGASLPDPSVNPEEPGSPRVSLGLEKKAFLETKKKGKKRSFSKEEESDSDASYEGSGSSGAEEEISKLDQHLKIDPKKTFVPKWGVQPFAKPIRARVDLGEEPYSTIH